MDKVKLIAGRSNKPLAQGIASILGKQLVNCTIDSFANGEINIEVRENIRGASVFIIQSGGSDKMNSINDYILETLLLIDCCKRSDVAKVGIIVPCFPYSRADKKDKSRVSIGGSMVANILKKAGCDRIISLDLHAGQIQGFVQQMPFDNLYGIKLHIDNLQNTIFKGLSLEEINSKYVLVSLDVGGGKRIKEYAKRLNMRYSIMDKQRDYSKNNVVLKSVLIGEVTGKIAICIDDLADTAGTIISGVSDLKKHGALSAIILVTHGVFSNPAAERLNSCDFIEQVIVINTLDQTQNQINIPKLKVIDSSPLLSEVIKRITVGGSISELFE